jgi:hypothetical protein
MALLAHDADVRRMAPLIGLAMDDTSSDEL